MKECGVLGWGWGGCGGGGGAVTFWDVWHVGDVWQLHFEPSGFVMKCRQFFLNTFVMNHECI